MPDISKQIQAYADINGRTFDDVWEQVKRDGELRSKLLKEYWGVAVELPPNPKG